MVADHVLNGTFHIVAEPASVGVAPAEISAQKTNREFLVEFFGFIGVLDGFEEIAMNRPSVAAHEFGNSRNYLPGCTVVGFDQRRSSEWSSG